MLGKYGYLFLGLLIGAGGVVGFSDIGPVQVNVETDEGVAEDLAAADNTTESESGQTEQQAKSESDSDSIEGSDLNRRALELAVHEEINEVRAERNLGQLNYDNELQNVSRYHSDRMAEYDYFAHESPSGETMQDRYERFGYSCRVLDSSSGKYVTGGENIWKVTYNSGVIEDSESTLAEMAVSDWMDSQGHRENVVAEYWQNEAIGVAVRDKPASKTVLITQNFC